MALSTSIRLEDGVSPALKLIEQNLKGTLVQFKQFQSATEKAINTQEYDSFRGAISGVGNQLFGNTLLMRSFNGEITKSALLINRLKYALGPISAIIAGAFAAIGGIKAVDEFSRIKARLNLINDGLQSTNDLNDKIFSSAQRVRASYSEVASTVSKLGILAKDAFHSNDEMIFFAEQINKQFKIGGASLQEQSSAMYQLTQAMAAGKLQGDEFRSIMENAPMLARAIAREMDLPMGKLKEMSSEGLITADVIKSALIKTADETNQMFEKMPITFGEIGTVLSNVGTKAFQSLSEKIGGLTISNGMQTAINLISNGLAGLAVVAEWVFNGITIAFDVATWTANTMFSILQVGFGVLEAILPGIVAGLGAYLGYLVAINGATILSNTVNLIRNGYLAVTNGLLVASTAGTTALAAAQAILNAVMQMNPMGLIIILLGLLIGGLGAASIATNGLRETFAIVWSGIVNTVGWAVNLIIDLLNVLGSAMNSVGGKLGKMLGFSYTDVAKIDHVDVSGLDAKGQEFIRNFDMQNLIKPADVNTAIPGGGATTVPTDMAKTANNTGKMAESLESIEEDLSDMRLSAEREAINKFTNGDIKIEIVNHNNVSNDVDLDGIGETLGRAIFTSIRESREAR